MEGLSGGGTDFRNPVATMQSGIVTSLTDWWVGGGSFEKTKLVQHNLGATGGASGSPIFNADGKVVGILSAGNIIGQVQIDGNGDTQVIRAPSAAMINFAQRVDLLNDLLQRN
jgi:S1-C subfamily serine protease